MRADAYKMTRLVFFTAKPPAPIFTINKSNDVISCKDVPFGGPENKILHFDLFFPKRKSLAIFTRT